MKHKLLAALTLSLAASTASLQAQNSSNQPYSQYGIGTSEAPFNMPSAARLGGTVFTRSGNNFINPLNPASYAAVERESFVFDMGLGIQLSNLHDNLSHQRDANGYLSHLSVAFPLTGWMKLAAGLLPVSSVEYQSVAQEGKVKTTYDGIGGVNKFFAGAAFNIPAGQHRSLSLGFNAGYLNGSIQRAVTYKATGSDSNTFINSRKQKDTRIGNLVVDFGLLLRQPLNDRFTLAAALSYKPYQNMTVSESASIYTYTALNTSSEVLLDTIFPLRGNDATADAHLEQPHTFGFGLSLERNGLWSLSADATFSAWQGLRYTENPSLNIISGDTPSDGPFSRFAAGFEKIGVMDASSYWGRISWSLGAHFDRGMMYLNIDNTSRRIDQWGVGGGVSLPMRKGRSMLTLSVAYNSLGNADLLQRNTVNFGISVSSCERWFVKRKYN